MAVTNRLALTRLQSGGNTAEVSVTPPGDGLVLRLVTTAISASSQASLVVRDSQGRSMGKVICQDGDDKRLSLEGFEGGALVFQVECNLGTVDVQVDELDDVDSVLPDSPGGELDAAAYADGSIATAKLEAGAATLPKFDNTGLKSLVAAGVAAARPVTLTGAAVGDRVMLVLGTVTAGTGPLLNDADDFESTITVVDQIQQTLAGDLSGNTYQFILIPAQA
jgi:hypothetical protein